MRIISSEECDKILGDFKIPAQPEILNSFKKEYTQREPDLKKIAEIISKDTAVSAGILKTINSSFFSLRKPVASIMQAVTLLGLKNVQNLVFGLAMKNSLGKGQRPFLKEFWEESNAVALLSARFVKDFSKVAPDEVYSLGLMCDCGVTLMADRFPEYEDFYRRTPFEKKVPITTAENERFATDHAFIGSFVARRWNLPEIITSGIELHHCTSAELDKNSNTAAVIEHLSVNLIARKIYYDCKPSHKSDYGQSFEWFDRGKQSLERFSIDNDTLLDLEQEYQPLLQQTD
ncbi:MAG: HDOD domain-containing protein [Chitinivibrionales bacterium]|nr:HDOD domain-containing protein [Chitinivibrionales bacterium]